MFTTTGGSKILRDFTEAVKKDSYSTCIRKEVRHSNKLSAAHKTRTVRNSFLVRSEFLINVSLELSFRI